MGELKIRSWNKGGFTMKKAKRIAGVLAFTAILIFTLTAAACGGNKPYTSKTGDGATYTLTVTDTKGKVSANPQEGETYTLKIKYPNKDTLTSGGTITNVNYSDGVLELTQAGESEPLNVTINSGGNITDIQGAIKLSGGGAAALSLSEEELTAVTSGAPPVDPDTIETARGLQGLLGGIFGGGKKSQSSGSGGGGKNALVGKWYTSQEAANAEDDTYLAYEFKSNGQWEIAGIQGTGLTYTVKGNTIHTKVMVVELGTSIFTISGTAVTFSNVEDSDAGDSGLGVDTYYKKAK
jgi:hypothetical protein